MLRAVTWPRHPSASSDLATILNNDPDPRIFHGGPCPIPHAIYSLVRIRPFRRDAWKFLVC